jgi:4-diphosphocytidyl-2-C-methyl-D-erythritol kinase
MLYPAVDQALNWLNQYANARLTGTGACVFASFLDLDSAESVMKQMPSDYRGFIAQGMDHSLTHEQLYNCINK